MLSYHSPRAHPSLNHSVDQSVLDLLPFPITDISADMLVSLQAGFTAADVDALRLGPEAVAAAFAAAMRRSLQDPWVSPDTTVSSLMRLEIATSQGPWWLDECRVHLYTYFMLFFSLHFSCSVSYRARSTPGQTTGQARLLLLLISQTRPI